MVGLGEHEDVLAAEIVGRHPAWALKIVLEEGLPAAVRDGFWVGETALSSGDGSEIPVSQLILVHKDEDGTVDYLSTVARDISALKQVEEALRESEKRYRSFVRNSPGIAFRGRMDYTPVFFHGAVEEITGYAEADFVEAKPRWDQVIHKEDFRRLMENFDAMATIPGFVTQREYRIVRKDGQIRWVQENSRNACDASGTPRYVDGTLIDITERKRVEAERRSSKGNSARPRRWKPSASSPAAWRTTSTTS